MTELIPCGRPRRPRAGVLTEPVSERSGRFERSSDAVISSSQARPLQCSCLRCPVLIEGDTDRRHMTLSVHNVCRYSGPSAAVVPRQGHRDRKSVGSGKSVSVRVDLGGRRLIKKTKKTNNSNNK